MSELIFIPVSAGEMFDKITILEIKEANIGDTLKRQNVTTELNALREQASTTFPKLHTVVTETIDELRKVNADLWEIEDRIRDCERNKDFGQAFIGLARSVYIENDKRAMLKKRLNVELGSALVEEKSYKAY